MIKHNALYTGLALVARAAIAQPIAVAANVDTVAPANRAAIALWRDYLRDRGDTARAASHWIASERAQWPTVDLTASWIAPPGPLPDDMKATIVDVGPDVPGDTSAIVVRTLFARATGPVALARVYAVRDGARWALANALPRVTRDWPRLDVGRITFAYGPGRRADSALAARAARFVDSAATAIGIAPPAHVWSYLAPSPREMARALGLDFGISANTGRVYAEDAVLVAGSPTVTEWNTHDLAHVVLGTLASSATRWWSEGAATWLGGRNGRDYARLVRELDADLARNPTRTLDSLVAPHAWRDSVSATGAAVLVRLAFQRGGIAAVRALVNDRDDTPAGVRRAAARALGVKEEQVDGVWRAAMR